MLVGLALKRVQELGLVSAKEGVLVDPYAPLLLAVKGMYVHEAEGWGCASALAWHVAIRFARCVWLTRKKKKQTQLYSKKRVRVFASLYARMSCV